jgi:osmotically-inducible protein OsmY
MTSKRYPLGLFGAAVALFMTWTPVYASGSDDRIESAALDSHMFRIYLGGDNVRVQARDGVVTLMGTVTEVSHIAMAHDTVAELPGVTRVDSRLVLSTGHVAPNSDEWLSARVRTALLFHRNVSADDTQVTTRDGMVTLRGEATSRAQRDLTTEYSGDLEGVDSVRNFMTVSRTMTTPTLSEPAGRTIDDASITAPSTGCGV